MAQIILIVIAIIAFFKESIGVTKDTEIKRPKIFIIGVVALVTAITATIEPVFYAMLFIFFILVFTLKQKKENVIK